MSHAVPRWVIALALCAAVCVAGCRQGEVFGQDDDDGATPPADDDDDTTAEPPTAGGPGLFTSVAADEMGAAHILHYALTWPLDEPDAASGELRYATNGGPGWSRSRVSRDARNGGRVRLRIDDADDAHASFLRDGKAVYGYRDNVSWDVVELDPDGEDDDGPGATDLALGPDGAPHVTYLDGTALCHAVVDEDGVWTVETLADVGDGGGEHALAVGADGTVHVLYRDGDEDRLVHLYGGAGGWSSTDVDGGGHGPALDIDGAGALHASYRASGEGGLRYATTADGSWAVETLDERAHDGAGATGIAVADDGVVHVVYYDPDDGDLRYATSAGGSWSLAVLDSAGDVGRHPSIAVDLDGCVHIGYMAWREDLGISALKYATDRTGFWEVWLAEDPDDLD